METNSLLKPKTSFRRPPSYKHRPLQEEVSVCNSRCSRSSTSTIKPLSLPSTCSEKLLLFTILFSLDCLFSQIVSIFFLAQVSSLRKHFHLEFEFVGFVTRLVEIAYISSVIPVVHFLNRRHVPRLLFASVFVQGVASVFLCVGYLANSERYLVKEFANQSISSVSYLCNVSDPLCNVAGEREKERPQLEWLVTAGVVLLGMAMSPRIPLSTMYIDNNIADRNNSGLYVGIATIPHLVRAPISFILGAAFFHIPQQLPDTQLLTDDGRGLGSRWAGYIILTIATLILPLPLLYFPKYLSPPASPSHFPSIQPSVQTTLFVYIKELPVSLFRILRCPVYVLVLISAIIIYFTNFGFYSFSPKYVESQFYISAFSANILQGVMKILSVTLGLLLGGYAIRRYKINVRGCIRVMLLLYPVSSALNGLTALFGCPGPHIHGFDNTTKAFTYNQSESGCYCSENVFQLTCGSDGQTYYSPCVAGCQGESQAQHKYSNCINIESKTRRAREGVCGEGCSYIYPFIGAQLLSDTMVAMLVVPSFIIMIRSVEEHDKPMALAVMAFSISLISFFAAPIAFRYIMNTTCLIWSAACQSPHAPPTTASGATCLWYDLPMQRVILKVFEVSLSVLGLLFLLWGYWVFEAKEDRIIQEMKETKKQRVNSCSSVRKERRQRASVSENT